MDAFIGDIASTSYNIRTNGLIGIKPIVRGPFPEPSVYMGVRSDWPELRDLIAKVLTASRFGQALIDAGRVPATASHAAGMLGRRVADPGGNLLSGYQAVNARAEWPLTSFPRSSVGMQSPPLQRRVSVI